MNNINSYFPHYIEDCDNNVYLLYLEYRPNYNNGVCNFEWYITYVSDNKILLILSDSDILLLKEKFNKYINENNIKALL